MEKCTYHSVTKRAAYHCILDRIASRINRVSGGQLEDGKFQREYVWVYEKTEGCCSIRKEYKGYHCQEKKKMRIGMRSMMNRRGKTAEGFLLRDRLHHFIHLTQCNRKQHGRSDLVECSSRKLGQHEHVDCGSSLANRVLPITG